MCFMNIKFVTRILTGLLVVNLSFADEVVYLKSSKPCQVQVYPAPEAQPLAETLNCGTRATILERRGPIVKIQVGEGKAVWVIANDTTAEAPAELEVLRLQDYQKKIERELAELNDKVKVLSETSEKLINALLAAEVAKKNK
jgi:hypothetical protein